MVLEAWRKNLLRCSTQVHPSFSCRRTVASYSMMSPASIANRKIIWIRQWVKIWLKWLQTRRFRRKNRELHLKYSMCKTVSMRYLIPRLQHWVETKILLWRVRSLKNPLSYLILQIAVKHFSSRTPLPAYTQSWRISWAGLIKWMLTLWYRWRFKMLKLGQRQENQLLSRSTAHISPKII